MLVMPVRPITMPPTTPATMTAPVAMAADDGADDLAILLITRRPFSWRVFKSERGACFHLSLPSEVESPCRSPQDVVHPLSA
jgi:hypothetical protein